MQTVQVQQTDSKGLIRILTSKEKVWTQMMKAEWRDVWDSQLQITEQTGEVDCV